MVHITLKHKLLMMTSSRFKDCIFIQPHFKALRKPIRIQTAFLSFAFFSLPILYCHEVALLVPFYTGWKIPCNHFQGHIRDFLHQLSLIISSGKWAIEYRPQASGQVLYQGECMRTKTGATLPMLDYTTNKADHFVLVLLMFIHWFCQTLVSHRFQWIQSVLVI